MPTGEHHAARGAATRASIVAYYRTHIGCTACECANTLGINRRTVWYHLKLIRQEWRTCPKPPPHST